MVYGVVCSSGSSDTAGAVNYTHHHHHQVYPSSAELHQYYAHHCQAATYDQPPQAYALPPPLSSAAVESHQQQHRSQQQTTSATSASSLSSLQDATILPPSYTSLDDYGGYAQHMSQAAQPYDYTQGNPCPPGGYPGYLDPNAQYRHVSMGLYPHHDAVRECGMAAMMGAGHPLPHQQPQQNVPTYKWMQVKRNVPKPGKKFRVSCQTIFLNN